MSHIKDGVSFQNLHPCLFLERSARVYTEKPAVIYGTKIYTYKDLQHRVDLLARAFLRKGVTPGDRIAYMLPNIPELLEGHYGPMRIGAVLVAINTRLSAREVSYILRHSGARAIVFDSEYSKLVEEAIGTDSNIHTKIEVTDVFASIKSDALEYETFLETGKDVDLPPIDRSELDTVAIDYTSGTTGFPKGVQLTHRNLLMNAYYVGKRMRTTNLDRICIPVPFYHCFGCVLGTLLCVTHGASMIIPAEVFTATATLGAIQDEQCTAIYGVPTMFIAQLEHPEFQDYDLSSLRTGIMAGSPCPIEVMQRVVQDMGAHEITIAYGLTEASPVITQTRTTDPLEIRVGTVGEPMAGLEVKTVIPGTHVSDSRQATKSVRQR